MLETVKSPADIKKLKLPELNALAGEVRETIIDTVARNGGHLASNLGTVELTIALHAVFDCPRDRILFDVGHQSYTHKLLTGRYERFSTLRQKGGLSGFMRPSESPYDAMPTGHASSAISIALGMARARDMQNENNAVVAVVGDGAMTGGMCYEALNDAGQTKTGLIVVLNDNEMSISKNVGAMSAYLTGLRQSTPYRRFKRAVESGLNRLPRMGKPTKHFLEKIRDMVKTLLVDDRFFTSLGFEYQGPIDGHDIKRLMKVLGRARYTQRPVLIHVVTRKGMGYPPAQKNPADFHGAPPFDRATGQPLKAEPLSYGALAARTLSDMGDADARVVAVTAAMKGGTGLDVFARKHADRLYDVGIAEEHAVAMAAGMAASGLKPYVAIYSTFLQRAYDQLIEDVCLPGLPVTLLVDRAGLSGCDGETHQGAYDLCYLRQMPGMVVATPRDENDLRRLLALSLSLKGPMAIRYPKTACDMGRGFARAEKLRVGEWEYLVAGEDAVILAGGRMVGSALSASIELMGKGVSCGVVDARFIKPMDEKMLDRFADASLLVTLEDGALSGGFGEGVARAMSEREARCRVRCLGLPDVFIAQASVDEQTERFDLTGAQVARRILEFLGKERV